MDVSALFGYAVTSRWFTTDAGATMHYLDEGPRDGPVVVFVHGHQTWCFAWRHLIARLRDTHRCIAVDHVGMGASDKPADYPYVLPRRVRDLSDLLAYLHLDRYSLVLHDWGGMIGCAHAVTVPERIERLVLMNTAAFLIPSTKPMPWQLSISRAPMLGEVLVRGFNAFCRYAIRHCVRRRPLNDAAQRGYLAPYQEWSSRVAVHRFVADIPLLPSDPWYGYIDRVDAGLARLAGHPVLIAWGLGDFVFDKHFLQAWRQRLPQARVHEFADCGHYLFEDAREELDQLVPDFLQEQTAS